jgi:hypothetical protein
MTVCVSEDEAVIKAMIDAYRTEANRTRPFKAPPGWESYGDWVSHECFAAVLAAVRRFS